MAISGSALLVAGPARATCPISGYPDDCSGGGTSDICSWDSMQDKWICNLGINITSSCSDELYGEANDDEIFGDEETGSSSGASQDKLKGGTGSDTLHGGVGEDWVCGQDGSDWLYGDDGPDIVYGGVTDDALNHGGDDTDACEDDSAVSCDSWVTSCPW